MEVKEYIKSLHEVFSEQPHQLITGLLIKMKYGQAVLYMDPEGGIVVQLDGGLYTWEGDYPADWFAKKDFNPLLSYDKKYIEDTLKEAFEGLKKPEMTEVIEKIAAKKEEEVKAEVDNTTASELHDLQSARKIITALLGVVGWHKLPSVVLEEAVRLASMQLTAEQITLEQKKQEEEDSKTVEAPVEDPVESEGGSFITLPNGAYYFPNVGVRKTVENFVKSHLEVFADDTPKTRFNTLKEGLRHMMLYLNKANIITDGGLTTSAFKKTITVEWVEGGNHDSISYTIN